MPSDLPRYEKIKRHLRDGIESGRWKIGARLPSEHELVRRFRLSRMTVNRALRELAAEGVVRRVQGAGSFVADRKAELPIFRVRSIREEIEEGGARFASRVIGKGEVKASAAQAEGFALEPGARLFRSSLVHLADGVPLQLEERLVNPAVAPDYLGLDFTAVTPNEYLRRVAPLAEVEHKIEAEMASPRQARLLEVETGAPILILNRRTWSGGRVVSVVRLVHPATRYRFSGRFRVDAGAPADQGDRL